MLSQYANTPAFQQIRQRILQDPNYIQEFVQTLAQTNPPLAQLIAQNPQAFLQILFGGQGGQNRGNLPQGHIQVSKVEF